MVEHYYSKNPKSPLNLRIIHEYIRGMKFSFYTASSVFSPKKVDNGTRLLAENMVIPHGSMVLDIGCGYGVLGIVAAKLCSDCRVFMSDVNERAVMLAYRNVKLNHVKAVVKSGDLYSPWKGFKFDVILSNPPMSAGKDTCFKIIEGAYGHLTENGSMQMVVKYRKGGKIIERALEEVFGNVDVLAKGSGYRVFISRKR
jgi:16S rRNA (guanine1207-N2)-methyltransferase